MREIKFRFRLKSKEDGEEIYVIAPLLSELNGLMNYPVELNKWEVLTCDEYTGLKDSNDKEIYEGDIVGCESNGVNRYEYRVVCYDSHQTKYKAVPLVAYHQNAGNGGWTGYELKYHNEVIGNIYDSPELLG
jgi:uncharacterized phage protein (TIGR01671 family)